MDITYQEYSRALKLGRKLYRASLLRGESPYLPVLEQLLQNTAIVSQESLGTVEIPLEQVIGTRYSSRHQAFTHGFMPIMNENTEFAHKWINLCKAHLESGIRDPIIAYEFLNQFYVLEGHKRVSVLKYFGAASIRCTVTRLIPEPDDTEESRIYQEFLRFYRLTQVNSVWFSAPGGFDALLAAVGTSMDAPWSEQERTQFRFFYSAFQRCYQEEGGGKLSLTAGDALLVYLNIYDYASSKDKPESVLRTELSRIWDEICNKDSNADIRLILKPSEHKTIFPLFSTKHLRIAFVHEQTAASSSWTYAHELGRKDMEAAFDGQVETICLDHADTEEAAEKAIDAAITDGSDLIFTTSPRLLNASVRAALENPKAKILNCSLNTPHPSVRTYYARMYEAKFLMGVIAGCLTPDNKIGYLADYPIYGITANINAFALGAKMVNPYAQVLLEWSKTTEQNGQDRLKHSGISYISDQDMITPDHPSSRRVGLYHSDNDGILHNTALSIWRWGKLYETIVRNYLRGGWKADTSGTDAINYWWGMDTGVIDLICSRSLPEETTRLVQLLRQAICSGTFQPFSGLFRTQDGTDLDYRDSSITPEQIITMDWLLDNITGSLPSFDALLPEAQALVHIQGIKKS